MGTRQFAQRSARRGLRLKSCRYADELVAILLEAYLGFLGLGVRAPTPTWGNIMGEANSYINLWNYWFFPALFIMLTTLGINFLGDGLQDALDPRSERR